LFCQAPAAAPLHFLVGGGDRHPGTTAWAGHQSFTSAPPGGDKLQRMMMQAQGMIITQHATADDCKGRSVVVAVNALSLLLYVNLYSP